MTRTSSFTTGTSPRLITSIEELRRALDEARAIRAETVPFAASATAGSLAPQLALVPTMGALHAGHLSLVKKAVSLADIVVVSIFVNPLQFGPTEDLDRYPQTLKADVAALAGSGTDFVFVPTAATMYPNLADTTRVIAGPVGGLYEGRSRPGHFDGVLTVVNKLVNIVGPDVVVFGQKDAQQVFLVSRMIQDLSVPIRIEAAPIVREEGGLALSSRNRFLSVTEHEAALGLSAALRDAVSDTAGGVSRVREAALGTITAVPLVRLDYLEIVQPDTFLPVNDDYRGAALVLVAATVGSTRLIDNQAVDISGADADADTADKSNSQGESPA